MLATQVFASGFHALIAGDRLAILTESRIIYPYLVVRYAEGILYRKPILDLEQVLWIRTGFNSDPDPAFYLSAEPDPGS